MKWPPIFIALFVPYFCYGIVIPPNYDFSLKKLDIFKPGSNKKEIEKKYKKGDKIDDTTTKYYVEHLRYKFPIFVQYEGEKVSDYFAKLPSYFLHDVFHQSLINKIGKQNKYLKQNQNALYIWNNKDGNKYVYAATCTITCFPIYLAVMKVGGSPLFDKFTSEGTEKK